MHIRDLIIRKMFGGARDFAMASEETRFIVSLDRLVKKQHMWGFHQGRFSSRSIYAVVLRFLCNLFFAFYYFFSGSLFAILIISTNTFVQNIGSLARLM